jgi:3D (Asp-Asp-Asp) domain-containing protein
MSVRRWVIGFAAPALAALALAPSSFGETVFALRSANTLVHFDSATPGTVSSAVTITGLQAGDTLLAIDFRPASGQLYAIGSLGFMYVINTTTGVATQVGLGLGFGFSGFLGMDFNPTVDLIRVVSSIDLNLRLNPSDGTLVGGVADTPLSYDAMDAHQGQDPNVVALAYTNNFAGASVTTVYGIDSDSNTLVRLGGVDGTAPFPNTGTLFTIGALGFDTTGLTGLDISPSGTAYALLSDPADFGRFFTINLTTGAATLVGAIAGEAPMVDIAVQAPTAVRMRSVSAVRTKRGVSVRWRTASSVDTLGFNVYRQRGGQRVRLNRNLIPAASTVTGHRYSFLDRRPLRSSRYWIQAVGTDGSRSWYGPALPA